MFVRSYTRSSTAGYASHPVSGCNHSRTRIHPTTKRSTVLVGAFCCSR
ncbi:hypothetical protein [Pleurocapsa sp. CCALA 161]|nr:hypothetical protein [Pleurocapsa sp. CCALA 161]